ncbi:MAG: aminotransferase class V-fold PLP-dependent enzyme [Buchananella hordeovulneris]|nr:aminotransferase class V-fold PLP-dependent enzyme [Buchananella hordeovulneris]
MIYLDYAATAPPRPAARQAYNAELDALTDLPGNASALHAGGQGARGRLETHRDAIATALGIRRTATKNAHKRHEIFFVSGATEGNALALQARAAKLRQNGRDTLTLCLATDHPSLRGAVAAAGEHAYLPVDATGAPKGGWGAAIATAVRARVAGSAGVPGGNTGGEESAAPEVLLAFAPVNNETGRLLAPDALAAARVELAAAGIELDWVHLDAAQTVGHLPIDMAQWDADSLTFSGHKIGASGGLLAARRDSLEPPVRGGGQQYSVRSGSIDTPGAASLAAALTQATAESDELAANLAGWQQQIEAAAIAAGGYPSLPEGTARSPHIAHLVFPDAASEALLAAADMQGFALSAGSACTAGVSGPSQVLVAMGVPEEEARCVLRVSTGWATSAADVEALCDKLGRIVAAARAFGTAR